jgi:8-oxo-dGTP pyrophosphatase MutT (NUDIX family)
VINYLKKLGVGVIIQNQNGDFLLHLRDEHPVNMPNQWSLVGGEVKQNENPKKAAVREVREETGFLVKNLIVFTTIVFNKAWDAIIFHARVDSDKQNIVLHEGKELVFFPKDKVANFIDNLSYSNPFLEALKKYLNK